MEFKKILTLFAVFLAVSGVTMAIHGATIDSATDQTRWDGAVPTDTDTTEGGNVTLLNLNGTSLTDRWAGYYGNISGVTLYLTDNTSNAGTNNYLYSWTATGANVTSGTVCASTGANFGFATAVVETGADVDTTWTFAGGADLAVNTYTDATCNLYFIEQGLAVGPTAGVTHDGQSTFTSCAINDGGGNNKGDIAFCVNSTAYGSPGTNFKDESVHYELIVPADDAHLAEETYFFFLELS